MSVTEQPAMVIFDWDNTLVNTWPVIHGALAATFDHMGHGTWTEEDTKTRVRKSLSESFPAFFGDQWEKARDYFYQWFEDRHLEKLEVLDGTEALLSLLHQAGIPAAVVSNKRGDLLRRESAHLDFDQYFHRVSGANDLSKDKPDPMVIDHILMGTSIRPGPSVWFVGDTAIDIECAVNAGLSSVAICPDHKRAEEFADFPPDLYCANVPELVQHLRAILSGKTR